MGYLSKQSLDNLSHYSYKGVDKYVVWSYERSIFYLIAQVSYFALPVEPLLELVRYIMAAVDCSQYS